MVFEQIERLKQQYTDKYVVVDSERPELRRFREMTGVIKTVNMNGRALVEFDGLQNIGWYDIDLDFLKVVDQPPPKETKAKEVSKEKKPAPKKAAPKTPAKAKDSAKAGGAQPAGMSVADILAAARGGGATKTETASEPAASEAPAKASTSSAKPAQDAKSMSVADILAAARGQAAPSDPVEEPAAPTDDGDEPAVDEADADEVATAESSDESEDQEQDKEPVGDLPTDVEGILAFCRQRDGD